MCAARQVLNRHAAAAPASTFKFPYAPSKHPPSTTPRPCPVQPPRRPLGESDPCSCAPCIFVATGTGGGRARSCPRSGAGARPLLSGQRPRALVKIKSALTATEETTVLVVVMMTMTSSHGGRVHGNRRLRRLRRLAHRRQVRVEHGDVHGHTPPPRCA